MKQSKSTYCVKTRRVLSRQESLRSHLREPVCLFKDLLHGGPSRISSPITAHPTAYEKFVMDKHMKTENTQKIYLSVNDQVPKSLISRKINIGKEK